jgi:hypothetical protein
MPKFEGTASSMSVHQHQVMLRAELFRGDQKGILLSSGSYVQRIEFTILTFSRQALFRSSFHPSWANWRKEFSLYRRLFARGGAPRDKKGLFVVFSRQLAQRIEFKIFTFS